MNAATAHALGFGALWAILGAWALARPAAFQSAWAAFPRNRVLGWIFATAAVSWASYKLYFFPLEGYEKIRVYVALATPVYLYGLVVCLPDLLAARMAACLLLLWCEPLLDAIRWQETPLRLVLTTAVYALVIACMFIAVSPYKLRQWTARLMSAPGPVRATGTVLTLFGVIVAGIGLLLFR